MNNNPLRISNNKFSISIVLLVAVLSGLLELFSISLVLLLLQLLSGETQNEPSNFEIYYNSLTNYLGVSDVSNLNSFIIVIAAAIVFANMMKILSVWVQLKVSWDIQSRTATKLLSNYMNLSYVERISTKASSVTSRVFNETEYVCSGYIQPLLKFSSSMVVLLITSAGIASFLSNFNLSIILALSLMIVCLVLGIVKPLVKQGKARITVTRQKHSLLGGVITGMDIIDQTQTGSSFLRKFLAVSQSFSSMISLQGTIKSSPRPVIEIITFILLGIFATSVGDNLQSLGLIVGVLGAFAYRVLPYVVIIISTFSDIAFYRGAYKKLNEVLIEEQNLQLSKRSTNFELADLDDDILIDLSAISIYYDLKTRKDDAHRTNKSSADLHIDLKIPPGVAIGIIGSSGAGKSTIARLISGIQDIDEGKISLNSKFFSKMPVIRYVGPEPIFFGFGIMGNVGYSDFIDEVPVNSNRAMTCLISAGFVYEEISKILVQTDDLSALDDLSSGQRQRIAIARALYDCPNLLVLDEALSNLDTKSLNIFFNSISSMAEPCQLLIITHDTRPLNFCSTILDINVMNGTK